MKKILLLLSILSILVLSTQYANAKSFPSQKEIDVSWNTYGTLQFNGLKNPYLNMTIERYFANQIEYKINIVGKLYWDNTAKLFKLDVLLENSNVEIAPYTNNSLGLKKIYGVLKLKNDISGDDYIVSLLRDDENTSAVMLPPGIENLELKIPLPEDAITLEDQNSINFPNIIYDNNLRIAYLPLHRTDTILDEILYEIVIEEGTSTEINTTYEYDYSDDFNMIYRILDNPSDGTAQILKRVSLIQEYPNYFDDIDMDITLSEISGMSLTDSKDYNITISGKILSDIKESDFVFMSENSSTDPLIDKPIQIAKFEATNGTNKITALEKGSIAGPPIILSWNVYPYTNSYIEISSPNGSLYSGDITEMKNFEITEFVSGEYKITAKNSLGSKAETLIIDSPTDDIKLYLKSLKQIDKFTTEDLLVPIKNVIKLRKGKTNVNLVIDILGTPPLDLNTLSLGYNDDKSYFSQILNIDSLYPGFLTRYEINISQLKSKTSTYSFSIGTNSVKKDISIKPQKRLKNPKYVFEKNQIQDITKNEEIISSLFENPEYAQLISKENVNEKTIEKIEDTDIKDGLLALWNEKKNSTTNSKPKVVMTYIENDISSGDALVLSESKNTRNVLGLIFLVALVLGGFGRWIYKRF